MLNDRTGRAVTGTGVRSTVTVKVATASPLVTVISKVPARSPPAVGRVPVIVRDGVPAAHVTTR
jgi:hypothetical protein